MGAAHLGLPVSSVITYKNLKKISSFLITSPSSLQLKLKKNGYCY
jgi:hypothetical protein